ncbi:DUF3014 domain-containing protein [Alteromonas sediminis]|uniref:DUF3014 domain-containing protein n=1 Tax=Alteromonas sediminis TaxID=2259342 RepID=A0A3N5Y198_9ALTE|nr:DUF3014 domain-containing protein [Alteromonas sediminis]RPJ66733.1 DUF3014 domain-containing protein [Alteromonas sediminis]
MEADENTSSLKPHIIIAVVIAVVILAVFFWPSADEDVEPEAPQPVAIAEPEPVVPETPEPEPEVFEATPPPSSVELDADAEIAPPPVQEDVSEPEPLDISDAAIETALVTIANSDIITNFLVNEALLERFVVSVTNLANEEMAPNHRLLEPPAQKFRTYQQAQREWIDPASYKRYTPYVDAMEQLDNTRLLTLFARYEEEIQTQYAQIGDPDEPFERVLINAIDTLLDTPEVKVPVEVYTDSVMFKYKDDRLENLSSPQKQLLRTGPDNMRRIKAKLREIKALLEERGS